MCVCGACELSLFHFYNFCFDSVRVVTEGGGCLGGVCLGGVCVRVCAGGVPLSFSSSG